MITSYNTTLQTDGTQFGPTLSGVSMTPAREAVRRLVGEGALTLSASGRVSTPELTNERIEELAALRSLIETELFGHVMFERSRKEHYAASANLMQSRTAYGQARRGPKS